MFVALADNCKVLDCRSVARIYNIGTEKWSSMSPLTNPTNYTITSVFWQGYINVFGGYNRGTKVERILLEAGATWEFVGSTKETASVSSAPAVIPYNQ